MTMVPKAVWPAMWWRWRKMILMTVNRSSCRIMQAGRRIIGNATLDQTRQWTLAGYARLPKAMTTLEVAPTYPVVISAPLQALAKQLDEMHT